MKKCPFVEYLFADVFHAADVDLYVAVGLVQLLVLFFDEIEESGLLASASVALLPVFLLVFETFDLVLHVQLLFDPRVLSQVERFSQCPQFAFHRVVLLLQHSVFPVFQDYSGLFGIIRDYSGLFGIIRDGERGVKVTSYLISKIIEKNIQNAPKNSKLSKKYFKKFDDLPKNTQKYPKLSKKISKNVQKIANLPENTQQYPK